MTVKKRILNEAGGMAQHPDYKAEIVEILRQMELLPIMWYTIFKSKEI